MHIYWYQADNCLYLNYQKGQTYNPSDRAVGFPATIPDTILNMALKSAHNG